MGVSVGHWMRPSQKLLVRYHMKPAMVRFKLDFQKPFYSTNNEIPLIFEIP